MKFWKVSYRYEIRNNNPYSDVWLECHKSGMYYRYADTGSMDTTSTPTKKELAER
ncbi:hypothetical protein [Clostridium pasteurianum]|uniref:hypothetical protein n=1 Tax=Clostridium pasteurianum TaxID=1501 RepID=UPI0003A497AA|nr:hypothetical protein [Clostridium pasteurianum]